MAKYKIRKHRRGVNTGVLSCRLNAAKISKLILSAESFVPNWSCDGLRYSARKLSAEVNR